MRFLLCNDSRALRGIDESGNCDYFLAETLRASGHEAWVFGGLDPTGKPILNVESLASALAEKIAATNPDVILLDLQWFADFSAGINMLRLLREGNSIPSHTRVVIASRFMQSESTQSLMDLGVAPEDAVNRFTTNIRALIAILTKSL